MHNSVISIIYRYQNKISQVLKWIMYVWKMLEWDKSNRVVSITLDSSWGL